MDRFVLLDKRNRTYTIEYLFGNTGELPALLVAFQCTGDRHAGLRGYRHYSEFGRLVENPVQKHSTDSG